MHDHMNQYGWGGWWQAKRGDIGPILLGVLAERPMHGYEIIRHLEDKSHGLWRPSPGSVYPTLQLLEEQDLVSSQVKDGKKTYELTEAGRAEAGQSATQAPWEWNQEQIARIKEVKTAVIGVVGPFKRLARSGDGAKLEQALAIMAEAQKKLDELSGEEHA